MQASRFKIALSVVVLVIGLAVTVLAVSSASFTATSGILIDFGEYDVVYTGVDTDDDPDPVGALEYACDRNGLELVMEGGRVVSIGSVSNGSGSEWSLFVVERGQREWTRVTGDPSDIEVDDYSAVCWGYRPQGGVPTCAVDDTGVCFYGYPVPERVVAISPSVTETVCAVGGLDRIVGTDMYSNYPSAVAEGHEDGSIAVVGGFTNPSYEMVLKQDPDLVVCIGSQNAHVQMAEKLRSVGVDVLVTNGGEAISTVMDNTYMVGVALGLGGAAVELIGTTESQIGDVEDVLRSYADVWDKPVMLSLSAVKSPWVSGSNTYISDIMTHVRAHNVYSGESGWVQVNAETVLRNDPHYIVVVTNDYEATQSDYDAMIASMSSEWRGTTAYKQGNIYLLVGDACDLASRPGPRVAQMAELMARMVHGGAFDDGIDVPKFIGDGYRDYLTFTKEGSV